MNSSEYNERFRAEYFQLQNRVNRLSIILDNYRKGTLNFKPKCSIKLLDGQMRGMLIYKTHLEEAAKIQGISLEEVMEVETLDTTEQTEETK
jgi:hypothetical protein